MRRVINIRQPSRLLADCSCSSRPSVTSSPAARCLVSPQQHRDLSSSSSSSSASAATRRPCVSERRPAVMYTNGQSRSVATKKPAKKQWETRNGMIDEYMPETDPDLDLAELDMEVTIKAPGRLKLAPTPDKIDDSTYIPAVSAEGLDEVGGVADWWENDNHWAPSMSYVGFGRREKVTDAAVLEAMTRRAVIETLAVREVEGDRALAGTWMTGGREAMLKALEVDVQVGESGHVSLKGDLKAVVEGLKPQAQPEVQEAVEAAEVAEDVAQEDSAVASDQEAYADVLPSSEAHQLRKSWDKSWKSISIEEPRFKFALNKRIQQLTGHVIPDYKLLTVRTVASYLTVLVKPAPPKKLAELIEQKGELPSLPNVKVYPRRVTPIDKEKMVGRWKVIVRELEKRDLPVTGNGGFTKTPEKRWANAKA